MQKVLVTGACGQVGHELCQQLGADAMPKTRENFDISNFEMVNRVLPTLRPDVVVHAAGWVPELVEQKHRDTMAMWQVNVLATTNLLRRCVSLGIPFLFISSNRVFGRDGLSRPRKERDVPVPADAFGVSKLNAETMVLQEAAMCNLAALERGYRWWIVRTGHLFERPWRASRNFVYQFVTESRARVAPAAICSQGSTSFTYVPHLVTSLLQIIRHPEAYPDGIYHAANQGHADWCEFFTCLAKEAGLKRKVIPAQTARESAYPPSCTGFDTALRVSEEFTKTPCWRESVREYCSVMREL